MRALAPERMDTASLRRSLNRINTCIKLCFLGINYPRDFHRRPNPCAFLGRSDNVPRLTESIDPHRISRSCLHREYG